MALALDASHDLYLGNLSGVAIAREGAAVAQGILTRLRLFRGEWFLNVSAGTPWFERMLASGDIRSVEREVKRRIFDTPGVESITSFSVDFDGTTRSLTITFEVDTVFGPSGILEVSL